MVNLHPIASHSNFKLTTSSGKNLEDISHAHIVSLMYKHLTSSRGSDDLFLVLMVIVTGKTRDDLTRNKNVKGKYHVRFMLKEVFGLAEHQERAT